jgi:hypothetical protein
MTTRRRRIAGIILAFLVGTMAVGWFGSRGGNPDVKLLFLHYTNAPVIVASTNPNTQYSTQIWTEALLLATNAGSVTVRWVPVWRTDDRSHATATLESFSWGPPTVLKPGESAIARAFWPTGQSRWRAGMGLRRDGFRDRLADKFGKRGFDRLQKAVTPSLFSYDVWTYSDWITNLPALSNVPLTSATLPLAR